MYGYFDIGGTKTRVAVSRDGTEFCAPRKFATPKEFGEGVQMIASTLRELAGHEPLDAIGGGIAGPLDAERRMLVQDTNIHWAHQPLRDGLSELVGTDRVYLNNDSAIVALGEAHHGAGQGDAIMAYITVSTGVGGARVTDGHIDQSVFGFEPGHQIIDLDRSFFPDYKPKDADSMLSGTSIERRLHKKAIEVVDPAVWEEMARLLAYFVNNVAVMWSPNSIVLGGSMMVGDPAIPLDRVEHHLQDILTIFPEKPRLKRATLADLGGLYGAMVYVNQLIYGSTKP